MKKPALKKFVSGAASLLCGCLLTAAAFADTALPEWSGSIKSLNLYGEAAPADLFPDYRLSSNRARLNMDWQLDESWQFTASLDHQYLWSDPSKAFPLASVGYNRHLDMDRIWQHGDHGASRLQVDRLALHWRTGKVDTTLGRQAVGFGRILIYSPLDVIAPFAPDAIDTDIRSGIDSLHSILNYGLDGQLGAIAVWGEESRHDSLLATWSDNRADLDILMIAGRLRGHHMLGAGLAGNLGTLGLKAEFSVHKNRDSDETAGVLLEVYTLAAIETWYRFESGISLIAQYLYNGPGANDPKDYLKVLASPPLQEGLTHLLGQHYLIAAPSYELHPLATLQGLLLYNLADDSALVRPTLDLSLADNLSLQLFWTWNIGQKPQRVFSLPFIEPRSEFGLRGDSGGLFLKWFF
ncbi:MAG: hypothetical protein RQ722_05910 [Desulfuromonadales bacterium]|nr:hypothetical protein [Desulfuromonadales bacterium]